MKPANSCNDGSFAILIFASLRLQITTFSTGICSLAKINDVGKSYSWTEKKERRRIPQMIVITVHVRAKLWNHKQILKRKASHYCSSIQSWERERFRLTKGYLSSIHNINNILTECSFVNYSTCSYRIVWDTMVHHEELDFSTFGVWI